MEDSAMAQAVVEQSLQDLDSDKHLQGQKPIQ